jgi:hypothetical protein
MLHCWPIAIQVGSLYFAVVSSKPRAVTFSVATGGNRATTDLVISTVHSDVEVSV